MTENFPRLTPAEVGVLRWAAHGLSNKEIAHHLSTPEHKVQTRTVTTHFANIHAKFQVDSRMKAILHGFGLGYLEYDLLAMMQEESAHSLRYATPFQNFYGGLMDLKRVPETDSVRSLASFGVLLLAISCAAARQINGDTLPTAIRRGGICAINTCGAVETVFGSDVLHTTLDITIAPPQAARQGFAPGNLFVTHELHPQQNMNRVAVSEFTTDGAFVRTFSGGNDIRTRLIGPSSLTFSADGRLLVTSGWLTDAILAFSEGSNRVERYAEGLFLHLASGPKGRVYGVTRNAYASWVQVFEPNQTSWITVPTQLPQMWNAVAVTSHEECLVCDIRGEQGVILKYAATRERLMEWMPPGYKWGEIAIDALDRLYVPCQATGDIKIFRPDGTQERRVDLVGQLQPRSLTIANDGRIWVCGSLPLC